MKSAAASSAGVPEYWKPTRSEITRSRKNMATGSLRRGTPSHGRYRRSASCTVSFSSRVNEPRPSEGASTSSPVAIHWTPFPENMGITYCDTAPSPGHMPTGRVPSRRSARSRPRRTCSWASPIWLNRFCGRMAVGSPVEAAEVSAMRGRMGWASGVVVTSMLPCSQRRACRGMTSPMMRRCSAKSTALSSSVKPRPLATSEASGSSARKEGSVQARLNSTCRSRKSSSA